MEGEMGRKSPANLGSAMAVLLSLVAACQPIGPAVPVSARADFAENCATCHGDSGHGNGPAAAGLSRKPADLTGIAARNGGEFPMARVMSTINGYFRPENGVMPHFGDILQSETVLVDTGDGIATPAPERLVALAEYLRALQE